MKQSELDNIAAEHGKWLRDEGGSRVDLRGAYLTNANLRSANLRDANLTDANLTGVDLRGAYLTNAHLRDADLTSANLTGVDLTGVDLRYANLTDANLHGANLTGANLRDANLRGADLRGANLTGAYGGNSRMQCLQIDPYKIIVLDKEIVWGGCTKKTVQEWLDYDDDRLNESDKKYLETITKPFIKMCIGAL